MRSRHWLSYLLLLCVCLSVLFSGSSIAYGATEDIASTIDDIRFITFVRDRTNNAYLYTLYSKTVDAGNWGIGQKVNIANYRWSPYTICEQITYTKGSIDSPSLIAKKGESIQFVFTGLVNYGTATHSGTDYYSKFNHNNVDGVVVSLLDSSGTTIKVYSYDSSVLSWKNDLTSISIDIPSVNKDVYQIIVEIRFQANSVLSDFSSTVFEYASSYNLVTAFNQNTFIQVFVEDGSKGLLNGIINLVTNIKDGVGNLISGITELPSKLWGLIENGLKGLFVPTESEMTDIKTDWDNLLSERFGGLYQSVQLIDEYADTFTNPENKNTIKLPELKLPFGQAEFVFGGQDVQIVPDKFSFLIDAIKTIISILATCLFVNGLRNRFEKVVGGEE